jgi:hypothetical protein
VHRPDTHSTFQVQGAPIGPGVTGTGSQVPVWLLHVSVPPHDQPDRQSGRHAPTDAAHTYPLRHSPLVAHASTQNAPPVSKGTQVDPAGQTAAAQSCVHAPPVQ